ncbi:type II CAAX endopeptidase family protein [Paenibacillus sp.]|uniref:CPBP family intramembrane glutamic endopeptidase n=1 Tax=Paenibacillus sp. TaxID=58172 RepID=UPI0028A77353|nr:type II CAAX endopeptidase family protein [Paenibacillus sp.]
MNKSDFFRFERKNDDFPFYSELQSPTLNLKNSLIFLIAVAVGFALFLIEFGGANVQPFMNVIFPLAALIFVARSQWTSIFRKLVAKDIILILGTYIVNLIVTFAVGSLLTKLFSTSANPVGESFNGNFADALPMFLKMIPMLFGEELITILPFLVALAFGVKKLKMSRKSAIILACVVSAILFGAYHLPTYNWNIVQAVIGIGIARIILLYPYLKTKNIWTSFIVHVMNDWTLFGINSLIRSKQGLLRQRTSKSPATP